MKKVNKIIAMVATALFLFSCQKNMPSDEMRAAGLTAGQERNHQFGYVYTLSNEAAGNRLLVYSYDKTGNLTYISGYDAGGTGTGTGLGNQGAVAIDENILVAVNPGSNTISSFVVSGGMPELVSTVSSGGTRPISVTIHNNIVYVLNDGTSDISGFMLEDDNSLTPIANSTRSLSSAAADPAQISFVENGVAVAITEKATNKITSYTIDAQGMPGEMHSITSANTTPFGFAVGKNGYIYVSEAAGGASGASTVSSYQVSATGAISLIEGPVSAGQTAACWVVITNNGKYVYATNTGSNNLSSFMAGQAGSLDVLEANAGPGMAPIDAAINRNSKLLFVLNSGDDSISSFEINNNGNITVVDNITAIPDGATGLVSW
jgi:6-phosphogluconolactonase